MREIGNSPFTVKSEVRWIFISTVHRRTYSSKSHAKKFAQLSLICTITKCTCVFHKLIKLFTTSYCNTLSLC